jgi:beta-N-acetylhexosaminidase
MGDSVREKIGQLFLVGISGETLGPDERLQFEEYGFGGFVLFKRNCREASQIASLCRALWDLGLESPPFIAIDQEGGRVHRLPPPFTHFPAAARIGARNNSELAYHAGRAAARELSLAGINLNFAPVLDVRSNPDSPIIGDRAFAADPLAVTTLGWSWAQGLGDGGIIPCGKHFPGHGRADKDSHFELPVVAEPVEVLKAAELRPFVHACRNQIAALMTAHVLYPALDSRWPATLSERIVTGLLRQELGYGGVVFSDDMEMHAISNHHGVEESALRALMAGVDMLLFCHELARAVQACEFLCAQSASDAALRARVEESHGRITRLKQRYLTAFTGASEETIVERLGHARVAAEIYGSL